MRNVSKWKNAIHEGDAFDLLNDLPENSIHAIVTDPPYGLAFMGRDWDDFNQKEYQEWCEEWAEKTLRVLKPGGHLLAFSGNRTHHRLFTGVEDSGFEIRDTITWHYGGGFPKNTDTQLKPATEFVVMARKPFGGPAKDCYSEHGTAYLNIDECRILSGERPRRDLDESGERDGNALNCSEDGSLDASSKAVGTTTEGRYPSNLVFDEAQSKQLDRTVGDVNGCSPHTITDSGERNVLDDGGLGATDDRVEGYADSGGPSRYFYTSKASNAERTLEGKIDNAHPTVKPIDLMEWLVKLVTREDQLVLDPFTGSGTTCKAAKNLNRRFIGIEKQERWADVARVRCGLAPHDPEHVRADDNSQSGLEAYTDGGKAG